MKTSLKHGRTFGWCVIVLLTSPWITACPVTSGGARGRSLPTESFQAANQQRLFAFLVLLWTKTHSVSNAQNQLLAAIYFHRGAAGVSAPAGTRASAAQRPVLVPRVQQQPLQRLLPPRCPRLGPGQLWSGVAVQPCIRLLGKQLTCENPHPGPRPIDRGAAFKLQTLVLAEWCLGVLDDLALGQTCPVAMDLSGPPGILLLQKV